MRLPKTDYEARTKRQREHLANLQANLAKQAKRKAKLDRMYSDPDLGMTKEEYLKQKVEIDFERKGLEERIEAVNVELAKFQVPVSLETFDAFIAEITRLLEQQINPSPQKRRQLLQMLHVKVLVSKHSEPDVTGWFRPGVSSNTY